MKHLNENVIIELLRELHIHDRCIDDGTTWAFRAEVLEQVEIAIGKILHLERPFVFGVDWEEVTNRSDSEMDI